MHPEDIKAALRKAGVTQASLAAELGVARPSVTQAISGGMRSERIQTRIAEIVGQPVKVLWPNQVTLRRTSRQIAAQRAAAPQN